MNKFIFTKKSKKSFENLSNRERLRVRNKLLLLKKHPDIFSLTKRVHDLYTATHRIRIGSLRMILKHLPSKETNTFVVLDLGKRKNIYRIK